MKKEVIELAHKRYSNIEALYFCIILIGIGSIITRIFSISSWIVSVAYIMLGASLLIIKFTTKNPFEK